jgi:hypothetical protein
MSDEPHRTSWWLEVGDEVCSTCLQGFHPEVVVHCEACDEPICLSCVVEVREERVVVLCASCAEASG